MKAYIVVGPTKRKPSAFSALDIALGVLGVSAGTSSIALSRLIARLAVEQAPQERRQRRRLRPA